MLTSLCNNNDKKKKKQKKQHKKTFKKFERCTSSKSLPLRVDLVMKSFILQRNKQDVKKIPSKIFFTGLKTFSFRRTSDSSTRYSQVSDSWIKQLDWVYFNLQHLQYININVLHMYFYS